MTTNQILRLAIIFVSVGICYFFLKNIFYIFFSVNTSSLHRKRLNQLNTRTIHKQEKMDSKEVIDKITKPIIENFLPYKTLEEMSDLEKTLEMSQWNKVFTPVTYRATDMALKLLGCVFFVILAPTAFPLACIWGGLLLFLFPMLHNNSAKERRTKLIAEFPEFIRITQGFLMSNMPLTQAIENTIPYVGKEWKPLLQEFVVNSEFLSQDECIEILSNKVDVFEVRELWSLIRLNSKQGIDIKESFNNQAEKVYELQLEVMRKKISERQTYSMMIQAPIMLVMIFGFGLPTIGAIISGNMFG